MDRFIIQGGIPLQGTVRISGAKNAALPCLAACLLTEEPVILENIPSVRDIATTIHLLKTLGVTIKESEETSTSSGKEAHASQRRIVSQANRVESVEAPWELVRTMRASTLILGPLLARFGKARVSQPGGCSIGARPIDLHIKGLEKLGATFHMEHGMVVGQADRLRGARIYFDRITVTGTEDLLMAATLADGETILDNAAREPEVQDLASLLTKMGANIEGAGTSTICVRGVSKLHGADHRIIPDRIEAGTFLAAAGITKGDLTLQDCCPDHLQIVIDKFREIGMKIEKISTNSLRAWAHQPLRAADIATEEYPGFPTDMQAQYMALVTQADGTSVIHEKIFENRFLHALEMVRMGANIRVDGSQAIVRGPVQLSGAGVTASDLRASASLVLAGLAAQGETIIERVYHIDRGYERIEEKLQAIGARIQRISYK
ncbi:MAG: UDP-N-acetylglucosamine 1-carboxyvinyltransferase [Acidobacteria bacterium RIFCSPLOWO2_12_FULL_54_10]|nr:MAG: UDP-N-acetylglucosamine 1-carboxyvinyltransferase [Acidobacteria bacterium RIFCSPLOWO2_12_FULL_54_10]